MLVNVPLVDQLNEAVTDGGPDEAARANCVPASLTGLVLALVPGATIHGAPINGDALRDAVYPESYTGATDPAAYVAYLAAQFHIEMTQSDSADGHQLVAQIVAALQRHEPATAAIPSMWGNDYTGVDMVHFSGGTHQVAFCDYDAATTELTAMNPWPVNGQTAFYQTQPAAWWAARIVYGRMFALSGGHMSISIGDVSAFYTEIDPQHWVSKTGNYPVQMGILAAYQSWPSNGSLAGLTALGLPLGGPQYQDQTKYPGVALQVFERGALVYDPNRVYDNPPGAVGPVYLAHYPAVAAPDPAGAAALVEVAAIRKVLGVAA